MATDLRTIVQRMIDAGESEEDIAAVIRRYKELNPEVPTDTPPSPQVDVPPIVPEEIPSPSAYERYEGPTDFTSGFLQSMGIGAPPEEAVAAQAGLEGLKGYLQGATLDIPQSILGALETGYNLVTDPVNTVKRIPAGLRNIADISARAGTDPEAFGRMMGQFTGQPVVTAGLIKAAPPVTKALGGPIERFGQGLQEVPPIASLLIGKGFLRTGATILGGKRLGRGIETIGRKMRGPLEGEIVLPKPAPVPDVKEGIAYSTQKGLPPSKVTYYKHAPVVERKMLPKRTETVNIQPERAPVSPLQGSEATKTATKTATKETPKTAPKTPSKPWWAKTATSKKSSNPLPETIKFRKLSEETAKDLRRKGYEYVEDAPDGQMVWRKVR